MGYQNKGKIKLFNSNVQSKPNSSKAVPLQDIKLTPKPKLSDETGFKQKLPYLKETITDKGDVVSKLPSDKLSEAVIAIISPLQTSVSESSESGAK